MTATRHSYAYYIVPVMLGDVLGVPIDRQGDTNSSRRVLAD